MAVTSETRSDDLPPRTAPLLRPTNPARFWTFIAINLAGFAVVNAFWQYLSTGRWVNVAVEAYQRDLATPMGDIFLRPFLSIFTHPWMILVTGLLVAVVIFVPIIVSVLYRLAYAAAFVAVVAFVGHAPVLAMSLAVGCVLAGQTPLRRDMPFLAALLGMVPGAIYLYLFGFSATDTASVLPLQRWVLYAPFVIALIGAIVASGVVLALARITRYRPGVIPPVLAMLLTVPLVIFYTHIGPGELDYSLIVNRLKPTDAMFEPVALDTWRRRRGPSGETPRTLQKEVHADLALRKRDLGRQCDRFLSRHRQSARAPEVLWVKAQSLSLQLDAQAFEKGLVKYTASYALTGSAEVWRRLIKDYPAAPQAAIAGWRLGEFELREGNVREAEKLLRSAAGKLRSLNKPPAPVYRGSIYSSQVFVSPPRVPAGDYYADALFRIEVLLWVIEQNNVIEDAQSARALSQLTGLNPQEAGYAGKLVELVIEFQGAEMENNLWVAVARATRDPDIRTELLGPISNDKWDDAYIEANYELGRIAAQKEESTGLPLVRGLKEAEEYFRLVREARANPWQQRLGERTNSRRGDE